MPDDPRGPSARDVDATSKRIDGPTPNGGVASVAYWSDETGKPCPQRLAVAVEIHELDAAGNSIHRTYARLEEGISGIEPEFVPRGCGDFPDFTAEDMAIVDEIWEKSCREHKRRKSAGEQ